MGNVHDFNGEMDNMKKKEAYQQFDKALEEEKPLVEEAERNLEAKKKPRRHEETGREKKPEIAYTHGDEHALAMTLMGYIRPLCYRLDRYLMRVEKLKVKKSYGKFELAPGVAIFTPLELDDLECLANREVIWLTYSDKKKEWVKSKAPRAVVKQLFYARSEWSFEVLSGLTQCPIFRTDGSILATPGYDKLTGLYADFNPDEFRDIPNEPTRTDAEAALAILEDALCDFPFRESVHKSVALAALLTAVTRQSVRAAPLFAFSAPCPGTGKSALADLISIVATGQNAPAFNYKHDETELSKSLFAMLVAGARVMLIDNITGTICNDTLCSLLTQETLRDRILGASKFLDVSTSSLIMANGNNLAITGDLVRRTMYCVLDADSEHPENRVFRHANFHEWAKAERGKLIKSLLAILRAHYLTGRPGTANLKPLASYEDWSNDVRGSLVWLGQPDPAESQKELEAADPVREANAAALEAFHNYLGEKPATCNEILQSLEKAREGCAYDPRETELYQALTAAVVSRNGLTNRTLGKWLAQIKGRILDGYQLQKFGNYNHVTNWRVIKK